MYDGPNGLDPKKNHNCQLCHEGGVDNRRLIDRASEQRWSGSIDRADLYIDPTDLAKLGLGGSGITPTKDKE